MDSSPTTIKAPDTDVARQFIELRTAQQERQRRIQTILFSPPTSAAFISAASPNRTFNYSSPNPSNESDQSSGSAAEQDADQIIIPCKLEFEFAKDLTPSGASIFNSLTLDNMIAGSAGAATYSSQEIYSSLISMAAVPKAVADLKTVKVAAVPAFISKLQTNISIVRTKDFDLSGNPLRSAVRLLRDAVQTEYHTLDYPEFVAQLIIHFLSLSKHASKMLPQLHRYLSISDERDIQMFEDACALGKSADVDIDFSLSTAELPGFRRLVDQPAEWVRLTTALIDFGAFMSNSNMQAAYSEHKTLLDLLRLSDFATVIEFDDAEQKIFSTFHAYASSARRSSIDFLDRGLMMLSNLPVPLKRELDRLARKGEVPENCMNRSWVISELVRLESRDLPEFTFWKRNRPAPAAPTQMALLPLGLPTEEDTFAGDEITVTCQLALATNCEQTFTTSSSYWLSKKDPITGKPFQVPKSCKPCRDLKRKNANFLLHNPPIPYNQGGGLVPTIPVQPSTADLTMAIQTDPDDDSAMADYASRWYSED